MAKRVDGKDSLICRVGVVAPTDGLEKIFTLQRGFTRPDIIRPGNLPNDIDMIVFSGGAADLNPKLYGQTRHIQTQFDDHRDEFEMQVYDKYYHKMKVGVCRGAQFLCAMNGGLLWQHSDGHTQGVHSIYSPGDKTIRQVTSVHHQICRLTPAMDLIAWAIQTKTKMLADAVETKVMSSIAPEDQVEAFFINRDAALGVQWHPEYDHAMSEDYFFDLIGEYLGVE